MTSHPENDNGDNPYRRQYDELARLASELAHEIKNPLSVINVNMGLLAEDLADGDSPPQRRALRTVEVVKSQCTRLENLLNGFLKLTRLSRLQLTAGNLNEQVAQVLDFYEAQARQNGVEIVRYLDPDLPSIMMDTQTLQAALTNLIKNAIEAMPDGGQFTVRTRLTRRGAALDLIDTGVGMDTPTAIKMFDPFFTTKDGGSGLGLPMAKKIIEAHGGRIDVESEAKRGTKFTLEFPLPARLS